MGDILDNFQKAKIGKPYGSDFLTIAELKAMPINYPLTNAEDRASRLIKARDMAIEALEQEPKIDENIHREREQAYMQGYEDASKKYRQEPKTGQYGRHIDHTDCIWYGSDSGCPVTCSQYRDGWNDAMDYIFKNGKGYQPYRHDGLATGK